MPRPRRVAGVALPDNVFRVRKPSGRTYLYYQERRGRPDKGPLVRLPDDLHDPAFWAKVGEMKRGGAAPAAGTFDALIARYKTLSKYTTLAKASQDLYAICCDKISAAWGALPVKDLLPKHIYALLEKHSDRPSIANMTVTVLRVLLKEAIKAGDCTINVARDIEKLDEAEVGSEPWPEKVFAYVLEHAPPLLMRAAVLARATGQRGSDLVKMRPADREDEGIKLFVKKLGDERHWVPLLQEPLAVIDGWNEREMVPYINIDGRRIAADTLRKTWKAWKLLHPDSVPSDLTLHDLRASAVCDRRLAGVAHQQISAQICLSIDKVMSYSKHIDQKMNARAGMKTMEQGMNADMKTAYAAIENRQT